MVALTNTAVSLWGSRVVVPGTGILLNNGMIWFDPEPGKANSVGSGKRRLVNMVPVLALRARPGPTSGGRERRAGGGSSRRSRKSHIANLADVRALRARRPSERPARTQRRGRWTSTTRVSWDGRCASWRGAGTPIVEREGDLTPWLCSSRSRPPSASPAAESEARALITCRPCRGRRTLTSRKRIGCGNDATASESGSVRSPDEKGPPTEAVALFMVDTDGRQ